MAVTKVADMEFDGVEYLTRVKDSDPCVEEVDEWLGLKVGDIMDIGAEVKQIWIHPESSCAWAVVTFKGATYEVDIAYSEDELDE